MGDIETALARTAKPVTGVRFGRVDAFAALQRLGRPAPHLVPTIQGYPNVGETLTGYSGVWAGAPLDIAYRWVRCRTANCTTVATTRAYRVQPADRGRRLRLRITATDGTHTITALSTLTRTVGR